MYAPYYIRLIPVFVWRPMYLVEPEQDMDASLVALARAPALYFQLQSLIARRVKFWSSTMGPGIDNRQWIHPLSVTR